MNEQDNNIDISDPLDWRDTAVPQLEPVELSLKCQICKEFYSAPVQTSSCGHTFCSLCIRRFLANQAGGNRHCPVCRERVEESGLRKNLQVEEIVSNYIKARPAMLLAAVKALPRDKSKDPSSLHQLNITADAQIQCNIGPPVTKSDPAKSSTTTIPPGSVICPICASIIPDKSINEHLDTVCLGASNNSGTTTATTIHSSPTLVSSRSIPPPPSSSVRTRSTTKQQQQVTDQVEVLARIPKPFYQAIKTPALKKKLQIEGLGFLAHRPRPDLELIYSEWVLQWNANADRAKPLGRRALIKEFRESLKRLMSPDDSSSYRHHNNGNNANNYNNNKDNHEDNRPEFDSRKWMEQNAESYNSLADQARRSITKRKASSQQGDNDNDNNKRHIQTASTSTEPDVVEVVCSSPDPNEFPSGEIVPSESSKQIRADD